MSIKQRYDYIYKQLQEGKSRKEIAKELGYSVKRMNNQITVMRKKGYDIPYYYKSRGEKVKKVEKIKAVVEEVKTQEESGFVLIISKDKNILRNLLSEIKL